MKTTCPQCGGEVELITQGKDSFRCRCGVVGTWWQGGEEGPPMDRVDAVVIELDEISGRLERLTKIMGNLDALRLAGDLDADALKGANAANRWLAWVEGKLARYYRKSERPFAHYFDWMHPLELIDAEQAIKAAYAEGDDPAELERLKGLLK